MPAHASDVSCAKDRRTPQFSLPGKVVIDGVGEFVVRVKSWREGDRLEGREIRVRSSWRYPGKGLKVIRPGAVIRIRLFEVGMGSAIHEQTKRRVSHREGLPGGIEISVEDTSARANAGLAGASENRLQQPARSGRSISQAEAWSEVIPSRRGKRLRNAFVAGEKPSRR